MTGTATAGVTRVGSASSAGSIAPSSVSPPPPTVPLWIGTFLILLAVYGFTASREVQWQDAGEFQLRALRGELVHRLGLALSHPLHHWLSLLGMSRFPSIEPAVVVTWVSVLCSAAMIANVAVLLYRLGCSLAAASIAILSLALAHTVWMHATISEVYGLMGLTLTLEWMLLAKYANTNRGNYLIATALINGVGVANHTLCGLVTPVHAAVAIWAWRRGRLSGYGLAATALAWFIGASPYWILAFELSQRIGVPAAIQSALVGQYGPQVLNLHVSLRMLALGVGYVVYNFPGLILPAAIASYWNHRVSPWLYRVLAADLAIYLLFAFRYDVPDQFAFFYPCYPLLAVLGALGLDVWLNATRGALRGWLLTAAVVTAAWPPLIYTAAYRVLRQRGSFAGLVGNKPYRDGYAQFFLPWNHTKVHATLVNRHLLELADSDAIVLCEDGMIRFALEYQRQIGRFPPKVELLFNPAHPDDPTPEQTLERIQRAFHEGRRVVCVPRDRDHLPRLWPDAPWQRDGDLYILRPQKQ